MVYRCAKPKSKTSTICAARFWRYHTRGFLRPRGDCAFYRYNMKAGQDEVSLLRAPGRFTCRLDKGIIVAGVLSRRPPWWPNGSAKELVNIASSLPYPHNDRHAQGAGPAESGSNQGFLKVPGGDKNYP
jgi:hypothetical protein